ncbi:chalcone isomerase family protein [Polaromonas sp.]|uniref:chalcone isomerase family protein n=1 Tax=Polaromonas sp. TaxID=1869339 RepID=UPI003C852238
MTLVKQCLAGTMALLLAFGAAAATVDIAGVKMEDQIDLRGSKLVLNGAGVRYKAVFKVYAAGLYLPKKSDTPEEALSVSGPKRITITMLREIDSNELGKLFTRSVQDNAPKSEMSRLVPGLIRMSEIFSNCKKLAAGDNFTIDWLPGTGTVLTVNTPNKCPQHNEPFKEPEFFNALMRIWLGPVPADWKLKDALLGKPA